MTKRCKAQWKIYQEGAQSRDVSKTAVVRAQPFFIARLSVNTLRTCLGVVLGMIAPLLLAAPAQQAEMKLIETELAKAAGGASYQGSFQALSGMGEAALPHLAQVLSDGQRPWEHRWVAAMVLSASGSSVAIDSLRISCKGKHALVRLGCIKALDRFPKEVADPLLEAALKDPALVVRTAAVEGIGARGDRAAALVLLETALFDANNFHTNSRSNSPKTSLWIREKILRVFEHWRSEAAVPSLMKVLKEPDDKMKTLSCDVLKAILPQAAPAKRSSQSGECALAWLSWYEVAPSS